MQAAIICPVKSSCLCFSVPRCSRSAFSAALRQKLLPHRAPGWGPRFREAPFLVVLALGMVSFAWLVRRGRFSLYRLLLFSASFYLGWQATRNSALFALVAAIVIARTFDDAIEATRAVSAAPVKFRRTHRTRRPRDTAKLRPAAHLGLLVAIALVGLAALSGTLYSWAGEGRTVGFGERRQWYAHEACDLLARPDMPERIAAFNLGQAGVCIAHAAPEHKLFMDPRLEVNSQETFERYVAGIRKLWRGEADWGIPLGIDYARSDDIPALLIERGILGRAIDVLAHDPRWRCVHLDALAAVFVAAPFAEAHGLAQVKVD